MSDGCTIVYLCNNSCTFGAIIWSMFCEPAIGRALGDLFICQGLRISSENNLLRGKSISKKSSPPKNHSFFPSVFWKIVQEFVWADDCYIKVSGKPQPPKICKRPNVSTFLFGPFLLLICLNLFVCFQSSSGNMFRKYGLTGFSPTRR